MGIDDKLVDEIIRRILGVCRPDRVILFGSAATGAMTKDSDIDLLVLEESPGDRREEYVKIRRSLRGMGYPFDILIMAVDYYEDTKHVIGGLAYPANKYGKVIYAR